MASPIIYIQHVTLKFDTVPMVRYNIFHGLGLA